MSEEYNHDLCTRLHADLDRRVEKGEIRMDTIWQIIKGGNGQPSHETRLDRIEQCMARYDSLFWKIMTPALPLIYGAIVALVVLWLQSGK